MQLVLNTRGSFLKKNKNCFLVKTDDKSFEVSADKVDSILITTSATITTDAVKFAVENNVGIIFPDHFGDPGVPAETIICTKVNINDNYSG